MPLGYYPGTYWLRPLPFETTSSAYNYSSTRGSPRYNFSGYYATAAALRYETKRRNSALYRLSYREPDERYVDYLVNGVIYRVYTSSGRAKNTTYNDRDMALARNILRPKVTTHMVELITTVASVLARITIPRLMITHVVDIQIILHNTNHHHHKADDSLPRHHNGHTTCSTTSVEVTEADARKHRIPRGYSLKNWDPSKEPVILLGNVFDANSLGKWSYDPTIRHHGPTETTGEL
ncbi:hypothetical protein BKA61DRAFT_681020 [Leptodontidium sp. MPI-SDFR-AT-0119]|nr:hypothetical protein BKA61DRAFT_681020 [Leptodontidium sp. MPI-SDFR-AT-0119]